MLGIDQSHHEFDTVSATLSFHLLYELEYAGELFLHTFLHYRCVNQRRCIAQEKTCRTPYTDRVNFPDEFRHGYNVLGCRPLQEYWQVWWSSLDPLAHKPCISCYRLRLELQLHRHAFLRRPLDVHPTYQSCVQCYQLLGDIEARWASLLVPDLGGLHVSIDLEYDQPGSDSSMDWDCKTFRKEQIVLRFCF